MKVTVGDGLGLTLRPFVSDVYVLRTYCRWGAGGVGSEEVRTGGREERENGEW